MKISSKRSKASSWSEWFNRCAQHYKDPRMKMAYYEQGRPLSKRVMKAIHEDVWKKLKPSRNSVLLDVGAGAGLFSKVFQKRLRKVIGTDIAPAMLFDARKLNPRGIFLACNAASLPFAANAFDQILCYSVFHYLSGQKEAEKVLNQFMRTIKPKGRVFIGDVLLPESLLKQKLQKELKKNPSSKSWWPSFLNHNLKKLTFPPSFFKKYGQKKGYCCHILSQNIPGKLTDISRYDVILEKT
ncbi:MAG: class I SAM-dependent methyltransferase [Candidatus Omnitrophota bacterium]